MTGCFVCLFSHDQNPSCDIFEPGSLNPCEYLLRRSASSRSFTVSLFFAGLSRIGFSRRVFSSHVEVV